jgi:hypothetical protein
MKYMQPTARWVFNLEAVRAKEKTGQGGKTRNADEDCN